jgi:hypothetical protein
MENNMKRLLVMTFCLWLPMAARAETAYVTERLNIPVYAAAAEGAAVRTLEAGATIEVLEKTDRFARVRDAQGQEGWIDVRHLSTAAPARARLGKLQEEFNRLRTQLAEAQTKLKAAEDALGKQSGRTEELNRQLAAAQATAGKPAPAPEPAVAPKPATDGGFSWGWLTFAFAMLVLGFVAGLLWLRESIRRRSGGMYLRV